MDEEDMSAFGFAPQALRASAKFQKDPAVEKEFNDDRKRKLQAQEPLLAHALINNILQPARETIGNHYNQNCRETVRKYLVNYPCHDQFFATENINFSWSASF
jgi:hypothetical protein